MPAEGENDQPSPWPARMLSLKAVPQIGLVNVTSFSLRVAGERFEPYHPQHDLMLHLAGSIEMDMQDTGILAYLHDSTLIGTTYDASRTPRSLILHLVCDPDAGYAPWNGRRLDLRLEDLVMCRALMCGFVAGKEHVDCWFPRISDEMDADLQRLKQAGVDVSGTCFTLTFHTGSLLEGVVRRVSVDVMSEEIGH